MSHQGDVAEPTHGTPHAEAATAGPDPDEAVMGLLAEHVPLTLLVDLVDAPASEQVLVEEGLPGEQWWDREGGD